MSCPIVTYICFTKVEDGCFTTKTDPCNITKNYLVEFKGFIFFLRKQVNILLKAKHMLSSHNENEGLYYLHALLFHSCHTGLFHQHLHCYLQDKRNKSKYGPFSGNSNFETSQGSRSPNIEKWRHMHYARNFNSILNKQKNCYLLNFEQQTKKMENYFHKNKSSFVVKTFKHFIHKYKSWEKGWIQCDLNIPRDLLRSKGQRRVLFPQIETCMSLNHLCSTKRNKYAYLRSHLKEKKKKHQGQRWPSNVLLFRKVASFC